MRRRSAREAACRIALDETSSSPSVTRQVLARRNQLLPNHAAKRKITRPKLSRNTHFRIPLLASNTTRAITPTARPLVMSYAVTAP